MELEKGKLAIVVGPIDRLDAVLATLIATTRAGEMDGIREAQSGGPERGSSNRKKAAA